MNQRSCRILGMAALGAQLLAPGVRADVKLPAIFSDHMVLQAGKPINVWGWGTPGQKVNAWLDTQSATETTVLGNRVIVHANAVLRPIDRQ